MISEWARLGELERELLLRVADYHPWLATRPLRSTNLIYERVLVLQGLTSEGLSTPASTTPSRLIKIRLHPSDVLELFEDVSTPQMHAAWQHGSPILAGPDSTPHRVLVTESAAARLEGKRGQAIKALHQASRA